MRRDAPSTGSAPASCASWNPRLRRPWRASAKPLVARHCCAVAASSSDCRGSGCGRMTCGRRHLRVHPRRSAHRAGRGGGARRRGGSAVAHAPAARAARRGHEALIALQSAQDRYFGRHARYAERLRLARAAPDRARPAGPVRAWLLRNRLRTSDDGLGYVATRARRALPARPTTHVASNSRIDQHGRRRALDGEGNDRSADCWR